MLGRLAQWMVTAADSTSARVYEWNMDSGLSRLVAQYVGPRAGSSERRSMVGIEQRLSELPDLVAAMQEHRPAAYVPESEQPDRALSRRLHHYHVTSALYLPLMIRERLIGCVEVWETERGRQWSPDAVHLCQTIAIVAAGAIDNARLFEMERQRRSIAETLRDLASVVSSTLELHPILDALVDRAAELIPYDSAAVFIVADSVGEMAHDSSLRVEVSRGLPQVFGTDWFSQRVEGLVYDVIHQNRVVIHADVRTLAERPELADSEYIRSWLGVPLVARGRVVGVLTFDSRTPGSYRRDHAEISETIAAHTAVAIQNARLFEETRQRLRELDTLRIVSLEMIQSLNLERVAHAIADGALKLLQATAVHLFSFDAETDVLQMIAVAAAPGYEEIGQPTPRREGLTMQVAHQGEAVVINDPANDPLFAPVTRATARQGVRAIVGLPLKVRERVLGVMNVLFHVPHTIEDNEVRILELLADQAATALENARLFNIEQKRRVAADVLREMSAVLTSTLNLDEVYERLFDQVARVIPYTSASLLLIDGPERLKIIAGRGFVRSEQIVGRELKPDESVLSRRVVQQRELLVVDDVQRSTDWVVFPGMEQIHAWMGAPLFVRNEIIGTLCVDHAQPGIYRQEQAELFGVIANQAAAAIANARLYEQALERERFASALGRVSLAITSTLELNAVLDQICRESAQAFDVNAGLVWLVEGDDLVGFAAHGPAREAFLGMRRPLSDMSTVGARVLQRGRGEFVHGDVLNDPANRSLVEATGVKSLLAVPLLRGNAPIGALVIADSADPKPFDAMDIERAEVLATHAAIAIENARLFQAEQLRTKQLTLVNRVGLEVTSILDLDQLTQTVVEEIRNAFGYYHVGIVTIDGESLVWRAGVGGEPNWTPAGFRRNIGVGIVGAAARGELVYVPDVRVDPRYIPVSKIPLTLSELALPLKAKGIVIGVLDVEGDRVNAFSEEDVSLLQALASQLSVAVENALLYQALAKHAASLETRVAERTAEIRREQERTFAILNSVADAVLVTDMFGVIVLTNPEAELLLSDDSMSENSGSLQTWLRDLRPGGIPPKIDVSGRTLQATVAYIREDDRNVGHVIVLRDITRMEEVDRLKTQFVSTVSHELRTPLTNIKLYLGLFQKGKPEKREQYLATLQSEASRLERLIIDLLDLSRLERARGPATHEVIDLVDVVRHIATTLTPQAEAKRQTIQLAGAVPILRVPADRNQLIQVFVNLVANAINYTPPGGRITLSWSTAEREGRLGAVVSVRDTGVGIPLDDQKRIFDRFYRGRAEQFDVRGTGLGLAIVKEILDQHSGRILVESEPGKGSTFTIWLPLSMNEEQLVTSGSSVIH